MRRPALWLLACILPALAGCGYHTVGSATHLPPSLKTLAIPLFTTQTDANHTEIALTEAVLREFAARTHFRVVPSDSSGTPDADAVLHGTILKQYVAPLTYNTSTQQSPSPSKTATAASSTRTRTTPTVSSTRPPAIFPHSSRKTLPPCSASAATSPAS